MAIIQNLKSSVYLAIKIWNILVVNSSASGGFAPDPSDLLPRDKFLATPLDHNDDDVQWFNVRYWLEASLA